MKIIKKDIEAKFNKANKILADIGDDFTFDLFGKLFYDEVEYYIQHGIKDDECETSENISFFDLFDRYVKELEEENRIGSAKVYKATRNSLFLFQKNLTFKDIDSKFLEKFERFHLDKGNSLTSVGIHARHIRTIINLAIDLGIMNEKDYPFGKQRGKKNKYSIPTARNPKKALDEDVINKIIEYIPRHDDEWLARDLWLFSFFCNGMNPADIFDLRWNQISKDNIIYTRNKTKRSKKDIEPIIISINPIVRQILFHWGKNRNNPKNYVFDIYKKGLTAEEKYVIKNNKIRSINQYMNRIAKD